MRGGIFPPSFFLTTPIQGRKPANLEKDPGEVLRPASYAGTTSPMDIAVNEEKIATEHQQGTTSGHQKAECLALKLKWDRLSEDIVPTRAEYEWSIQRMYWIYEALLVEIPAKKQVLKTANDKAAYKAAITMLGSWNVGKSLKSALKIFLRQAPKALVAVLAVDELKLELERVETHKKRYADKLQRLLQDLLDTQHEARIHECVSEIPDHYTHPKDLFNVNLRES